MSDTGSWSGLSGTAAANSSTNRTLKCSSQTTDATITAAADIAIQRHIARCRRRFLPTVLPRCRSSASVLATLCLSSTSSSRVASSSRKAASLAVLPVRPSSPRRPAMPRSPSAGRGCPECSDSSIRFMSKGSVREVGRTMRLCHSGIV